MPLLFATTPARAVRLVAAVLVSLGVASRALAQEEPQKLPPVSVPPPTEPDPPPLQADGGAPAAPAQDAGAGAGGYRTTGTSVTSTSVTTSPHEHEARHDDPTPPLAILPMAEDALMDPRMARSWSAAPARWFAATTVDIGFVYARPRLSLGYGKPFTSWFGVDINPLFSGQGLGGYGGLRLEFPFIDIRAGTRFWNAYNHAFMQPRESYARLELERESGPTARYFTHEVEIDTSVPAGPGNVVGRASVSYVTGAPDGTFFYEQSLRVIIDPPWVLRFRGGYAFRLGQYSQHSIGVVVDFLDALGRDDGQTWRIGPLLRITFSRRVELRGSFVVTAFSPDRIGLVGGDFTELGIRYRWATEPKAERVAEPSR